MDMLRKKIRDAANGSRIAPRAETFLGDWGSFSKPVKLACNDGSIYVVKGGHLQKPIVNEHIIGRLGGLLQSPVAEVEFIEIPEELRNIESRIRHISAGLAHGTKFIPDCSEQRALVYTDVKENKSRFALLCVLYSWIKANDHQCIYRNLPPNLVYSADHGHFFPDGPFWTVNSLRSNLNQVQLDSWFNGCGLTNADLILAGEHLEKITDEEINLVVKGPPDEWGVLKDERDVLTEYLLERRIKLLEILSVK